jgi:hypothetical protein
MTEWEAAELGVSECFVRNDSKGQMRSIKAMMTLTESKREYYTIGDGTHGNITTQGYYWLNRIAGLSLLSPSTTKFDGREVSNPHVEFSDKKHRSVSLVVVRKIAYGASATGSLTAVDKTVVFSLHSYEVQELVQKAHTMAGCGGIGTRRFIPEVLREKKDRLVSYPVDEKTVLWADFTHPEIQEVLRNHTKRVKFNERIATSMADRNCLRAHPAIGVYTIPVQGGVARVQVTGYRLEHTWEELQAITKKIEAGQPPDGVDLITSTDDLGLDQDVELLAEEDKETAKSTPLLPKEPTGAERGEEWQAALSVVTDLKRKDERRFFALVTKEKINDLYQLSTEELNELATKLGGTEE